MMMKAKAKLVLTLALCGLLWACDGQSQPKPKPPSERQTTAQAMFAERCKTAGEKIYKTVENVDSVFLMKLRPNKVNFSNQFELSDPYGNDLIGQGYIESFVKGSFSKMQPKNPKPEWPTRIGYTYVEAIDPQDGKRYRYTGHIEEPWQKDKTYLKGYTRFVMDRIESKDPMPSYGVTYDDISTREEREYWIAGSSLKVIDLKTNEVLAERIGYMVDWAQGSTAGNRSPWLLAADNACPDFHRFKDPVVVVPGSSAQMRQAQDFVEKVLKPRTGS